MIKYMSNDQMILMEGGTGIGYFKGIYFRFLSEFAQIAHPILPQEM